MCCSKFMKGLELSRLYFQQFGAPLLKALEDKYPALRGQFAAGLVGQGSECFGFDDDISRDHDFGPSFCIWLKRELYQEYADAVRAAYNSLPSEFAGFPARRVMPQAQDRVGVLCAEDFYFGLLGTEQAPKSNMEWLRLPETGLATTTNGEMFLDENGFFTGIREQLAAGYPENVRRKKIAARAAAMAQSGQYNYSRLCRRGEWTGAALALAEFIKNACYMVHLLNNSYAPFYKWMHRSIKNMPVLPEVYGLLDQLAAGCDNRSAWQEAVQEDFLYGIINTKDSNAVLIETVCQLVIRELHAQGLSEVQDMYLEPHALAVMEKIEDPVLKRLPLLLG